MKRVVMHSNESMATAQGPQRLEKGQTYELEDWIAASLIGRGFAHEILAEGAAPAPVDYEGMTLSMLRKEAELLGIEGFSTMKKAELLVVLKARTVRAEPPLEPFEHKPLTGSVKPPEFKA